MDADGDGGIGYDEFILLDEEKWRTIDPFKKYQIGLESAMKKNDSFSDHPYSSKSITSYMDIVTNDPAGHQKLEAMSKSHLKIPIRKPEHDTGFFNINRSDVTGYVTQSKESIAYGRPNEAP